MVYKLVEKSLQLKQLILIQMSDPLIDLFPSHSSAFLSAGAPLLFSAAGGIIPSIYTNRKELL